MKNRAKISIDKGILVYVGKSSQSEFHKHHAIQIGLALQGDYHLYINDGVYEGRNFILNSNVSHKHVCSEGVLMCILIDPETNLGNLVKTNFPSAYHFFSPSPEILKQINNEVLKQDTSMIHVENLIVKLLRLEAKASISDHRISHLVQKITSSDIGRIELKTLMQDIPLSESRLRHLFKMQTGISIQRYVLWTKLKKALYYIVQSEDLSEAAYLSGFSDYAHMSRTIKQMFGINLKTLFKDSHYVQDL